MKDDQCGKRFMTWNGGCACYPTNMSFCRIDPQSGRLTWDFEPIQSSFDGLLIDTTKALSGNQLPYNGRRCPNILWKGKSGDASHCLQIIMLGEGDVDVSDCGRKFITYNTSNGGCGCYPESQQTCIRSESIGESGRNTYELEVDPTWNPPCAANSDCTSGYCDTTTSQCATKLPASGGGDPHYLLHFNEYITVQPLCDIVLMNAPQAYDGLGVTMHARHATPKKGKHFYTYISNLAVKVGEVVFELVADTGKLLKNGSLFEIEEGETYTENGLPYTIKMYVKGQHKKIFVVEINDHFEDSKILLRTHRNYKMTYFEVSGFGSVDVEGFLGKTDMPGFFHRNGALLAESSDLVDLQSYTNAWQVQEDDLKLFAQKDVFPQAPHKCVFVDTADGLDDNDLLKEKDLGQLLRGSRRRLSGVDSNLHAAAVDACARLPDASLKKAWCIDDIMSSGNLELAEDKFYV